MLKHKQTGKLILAGCMLLLGAATQAQSELKPAGLAVYTDTARDIYLAAILTSSATLPADMENVSGPAAMEYRIATRRISSRGLSGTMLLQAELGSGTRAPEAVIDALGGFKKAIQGSLLMGDHVQVGLTASDETVFRLNGSELLRASDPQIFQYLLSGWVGETSSALLRESLLAGEMDAGVRGQYASLIPSDERVSLVASWSEEPEVEEQVAAVEVKEEEIKEEKVEAVVAAAAVATAATVKAAAPEPVAVPEQAPMVADVAPEASAAADQAEVVALEPVVTNVEPAPELAEVAALEVESADYIEVELDDREYQRQLGEYVAQVMTKVFSSVVYPRRAVSRSLQGKVALLVELDQAGELLEVSTDASSGHAILDRAAVKAVKDAAPFPELSVVAREEFASQDGIYQVAIPVTFRLN